MTTVDAPLNRVMTPLGSAVLLSPAPSYDAVVLADGPSHFWKFAEASGTSAADSAGTDGGTYQGGFTLGQTGIGDSETAVLFNGSTGYVSTASSVSAPQAPFSLECWFKTTGTSGVMIVTAVWQTGTGSGANDRFLYVGSDGKVYFRCYIGSEILLSSPSTYNDGNWHHAVGVVASNNNMTLYVDGASAASNANTTAMFAFGGSFWRIGTLNTTGSNPTGLSGTRFFNGTLAKPAIYPSALTATQVANHYAAR